MEGGGGYSAENMRPHFSPRRCATLELAKSRAPLRFWPPDQNVENRSDSTVIYATWATCDTIVLFSSFFGAV